MEKITRKIVRKLKTIPQDIYSFQHKDEIILFDKSRRTRPNHVNLHWCSENREDGKENVGDYLAVPIFQYMKQRYHLDDFKELEKTFHLYTIGSILFFGYQNAVVWGSGLLCRPQIMLYRPELDIRAVRGPRTRDILLKYGYECPQIYGDPAILMPLLYTPQKTEPQRPYSVILHKSSPFGGNSQIEIIRHGYEEFIDEIVQSNLIVSSSLHGIILAESYGIPAVLLKDKRNDFNLLKYDDYYFSTGRYEYPVAETIEEALGLTPAPIPNLGRQQRTLIESFPYDLWEKIK